MNYWKTTVLVSIAMFLAVGGSALGGPAASDLLRESGVSGGVLVIDNVVYFAAGRATCSFPPKATLMARRHRWRAFLAIDVKR